MKIVLPITLFLACATFGSTSAQAQLLAAGQVGEQLAAESQYKEIKGFTKDDFYSPVIVNSVSDGLWYKRPAGLMSLSFYGYFTVANSGYMSEFAPVLTMPAFTPVTFLNQSTDKAATSWSFLPCTDPKTIAYKDSQEADGNLTVTAGGPGAFYKVPLLKSGTKQYYWCDKGPVVDKYPPYTQVDTLINMGYEANHVNYTMYQGTSQGYYIGTSTQRYDFNQDGKAETVYMEGFHMYMPKPIAPIAINHLVIPVTSYSGDFFTGFEGLTLNIYKVKRTSTGARTFGDLIFTAELNDDNFTQRPGDLVIGRQAHMICYLTDDEENGFFTFDDEFAIEVRGFHREGVDLGPRTVIRMDAAKKSPDVYPLVYRDFINKDGTYAGSWVYADNDMGVPISFYGCYDVMMVDAEANAIKVEADGAQCTAKATVYTQRGWYKKGGVNYTLDALPEWVKSVKATKVESGVHQLTVVCDPLPAGVDGRSCTVHIKSFAGNLSDDVITITQGNGGAGVKGDINGDGVVDIADVNTAIDIVLGLTGSVPAADVNGDGVVDVADINLIIDSILGL